MTFIHPFLLYALGFLVVPFILQFFINRKKVVFQWAAYEWMRRAVVTRRKNIRITELLKLLSKLLLIVAIVLAVARPATRAGGGGRAMLVIDNTLSMATALDKGTRLDHAKHLAAEFVSRMDESVAIFTFDGDLTPLSKMAGRGKSSGLLDAVEVTPKVADARQLVDAIASAPALNEIDTVLFLSDFQELHYQDAKLHDELLERLGEERSVIFVPVDTRSGLANVSVDSYSLLPEGFFPGRANRISVEVRNRGETPVEALPVTLQIDGKKVDRTLVSLSAYEEKRLFLSLGLADAHPHRVSITIPRDDFAPDNTYNLMITPGDSLNVLAVAEEPGEDSFELDQFFASALRSVVAADYLKYKRIRPHEVFAEDLEMYDLLVTFGISFPENDAFTTRIVQHVRRGTGLITFNDLSVPAFWRGLGVEHGEPIEHLSHPDAQQLEGGYLGFMARGGLNPALVNFNRFVTIASSDEGGAESRLDLTGATEPVIASKSIGKGRAAFVGFLPYPGYTDFFYNPNFVQFCARLVSDSLSISFTSAYVGDEVQSIAMDDPKPGAVFRMKSDSGLVQKVEMKAGKDGFHLSVQPAAENSFCTIVREEETVLSYGSNVTREDSDIEPADGPVFAEVGEKGLVYDVGQSMSTKGTRREYPWATMFLLVVAALFEFYAHFRKERK